MSGNNGIYRIYDSSAINLIAEAPKVLQVLRGEIPLPSVVEIFLTAFCNFKCPHCRFREHHGDDHSYMPLPMLESLLTEIRARGVRTIELSGGGEPLAHPDIDAALDLMAAGGFRVGLISNGYCFVDRPALQERALSVCNWIRISVDAFDDDTYQRVHGSRASRYSKLQGAIVELVALAGATTKIGLKMLISRLNVERLLTGSTLAPVEEALAFGVDYLQFKFLGEPARLAVDPATAARATERIAAAVQAVSGRLTVELVPAFAGERKSGKCLITFLHPVIDWDGEIYACPFFEHRKDRHAFGNLRQGGFFANWFAERHRTVFAAIDHEECVPNCPMLRYEPVIEYIRQEAYRFPWV
jgi:radical SAM protein with 4Fe4S-binding SPASM domain